MEAFWFFSLNGVAVTAASTESYMPDGTIVKPVKKMKEVKPGILCSVIGPYEGIDQYLRFVSKRFELDAGLTADQAIEDLRWLISKKEVDVNELTEAFERLQKAFNNPENYDLDEEFEKFQNLEINKELGSPVDEEEEEQRWRMNRLISQIKIIEALPDAFSMRGLAVDPFTNRVAMASWYQKHSDVPFFDEWSLQKWKPGVIELGQVLLDLRKEYELKKSLFRDDNTTATHLQKMITDLDTEYNPEPAELEFMTCSASSGGRWVEMKSET